MFLYLIAFFVMQLYFPDNNVQVIQKKRYIKEVTIINKKERLHQRKREKKTYEKSNKANAKNESLKSINST